MEFSKPLQRDALYPVPNGTVVSVVTFLEMRARPPSRPPPPQEGLALRQVEQPPLDWYRSLYRKVGSDWLWFSRLAMSDDQLTEILHDRAVEVHVLSRRGVDFGLLELDRRKQSLTGEIELAFFGLAPAMVGTGAGRWLMERAIARAFAEPIERLFVHTCTLDHPAALAFYIRSGFVPYARAVEVAPDPRLCGFLAETSASYHPTLSG